MNKTNNRNKRSLIVISSYPPKGKVHGEKVVGIASYTKNTLISMVEAVKKKPSITVLAEKLEGEDDYKHESVQVIRLWKRNSFKTYFDILKYIYNEKKTQNILIEFEHAMFGELPYLLPLPILLLILNLLNKRITLVFHQVLHDLKELAPHINLDQNSLSTHLLNIPISIYYKIMFLFAVKVIVFEEELKAELSKYTQVRKIVVIPHGVEIFDNVPSKEEARRRLKLSKNKFVVLHFGFLAWYKGTDWIVHTWNTLKENKKDSKSIKLIIAGGPNPNNLSRPYYQRYVENIERKCKENNITLTGFVPEGKIPLYFKAADVVVFPYRTLFSASGPLSIAFSFEKPFLVSQNMKDIFETKDIKNLIEKLKIKKELLYFNQNGEIIKRISNIKNNQAFKKKITTLSKKLKDLRNWKLIGKRYYEEIFSIS